MKEFIKGLIDKYGKRVEKDIIGCGLCYSDNEALDKEVELYVDAFFDEMIGRRPTPDCASPEYEEWYRKFLVFCEAMDKFGKKYGRKYTYYPKPKKNFKIITVLAIKKLKYMEDISKYLMPMDYWYSEINWRPGVAIPMFNNF